MGSNSSSLKTQNDPRKMSFKVDDKNEFGFDRGTRVGNPGIVGLTSQQTTARKMKPGLEGFKYGNNSATETSITGNIEAKPNDHLETDKVGPRSKPLPVNEESNMTNKINEDQDDIPSDIPKEYLNKFGFVNYNHYGSVPWPKEEDVFFPKEFTSITRFLGIDCEMVGVGQFKHSALGRVSIVNEYGFCIYDRFVKPKEEVSDYRTEYSGIRHEDLIHAHSMDRVVKKVKEIVKGRVLVGHSIHNDLEVLELMDHPQNMIRDTAIFFQNMLNEQHPPSLKSLTTKYLGINIQDGEHSSIQDAQATLKLYLLYRIQWEEGLNERREKSNLNNLDLSDQVMAPPVDITEMNICPREKDVFVDSRTVFVRENRVIGSYSSSEEYRDVIFRLLLEDLFRPLRQGVSFAKRNHRLGKNTNAPKTGTIFNGVRIRGDNVEVKGKKVLLVPIERNNLSNIDWSDSKLFINGSLLLLSPDNFRSIKFATVSWRTNKNTDSYYNFPLAVQFCKDGPSWITKEEDRFQMMESVAYYEAYKHTLQYFQVMKLDTFPLKKYIVDAVMQPALPSYLRSPFVHFDFSVFTKKDIASTVPLPVVKYLTVQPLDYNKWPTAAQLQLDPSQYEAFQKAVTQELTIIQGPPGTGKTYIGIQVVKFLLSNSCLLKSPILIVSYTNHALDQVLEGILDFVTKDICGGDEFKAHRLILRMGGGSKSDKVEPMVLKYKMDKCKERNRLENQLLTLQKEIKNIKPFEKLLTQGIVDFHQLPKNIILQMSIRCKSIWMKWKNELNTIKRSPSIWFGIHEIQKKATSNNNKCKKNSFILVPFADYELDKDLLSVIRKTLNPESLENTWDEKSLPELMLLAFDTKAQLLDSAYDARWVIYLYLAHSLQKIIKGMENTANNLQNKVLEMQRQGIQGRSESIQSARIVGMTTTGAVKFKKMVLNSFKPQVMIVEEAAHVLEAHVVASLTEHCQQLIMIGDHKQLRPMTADNSLAKNYKLEISLMERLVQNGISQGEKNWVQLKLQHRMRPEIARMVCPVIYEELDNHPVVSLYPDVKGCAKNLFFINHTMAEAREQRSSSLVNHHEANFLSRLCQHFITNCGYDPSQITIIATYLDQKTLLQKKLADLSGCSNVRISTVDGYQGEENDIILLSLVRSNSEKVVGFLKTDNRVCVALSRARHGLFMMGNMSCLSSSSETWNRINDILREENSIGERLPLKCSLHGHISRISKADDFLKISCPRCIRLGRADILETPISTTDCEENDFICEKFSNMDLRNLPTSQNDSPNANTQQTPVIPVVLPANTTRSRDKCPQSDKLAFLPTTATHQFQNTSTKLPCGHDYSGPKTNLGKVKCVVNVEKLSPCGFHTAKLGCHQNVAQFLCSKKRNRLLSCGHSVKAPCLKKDSEIKCTYRVRKSLPCGHEQTDYCSTEELQIACMQTIIICEEHGREVKCHEQRPCDIPVKRVLHCGHEVTVRCYQKDSLSKFQCLYSVLKTLPCGHKQKGECYLDEAKIVCNSKEGADLLCEHLKNIPCFERSGKTCSKRSQKTLQCGHQADAPCRKKSSEIKCTASVLKYLPCGHKRIDHCHLDPTKIQCHALVSGCSNHQKIPCYKKSGIVCNNNTSKLLQCGHKNLIACAKDVSDEKCILPVLKYLPCGHHQTAPCYFNINKIICTVPAYGCTDHRKLPCYELAAIDCPTLVHRILSCGHQTKVPCTKKLSEIKCVVPMKRTLPCGHSQRPQCYLADRIKCNKMEYQNLPCGHKYQKKILCGERLPLVNCKIQVPVTVPECKHKIFVECYKLKVTGARPRPRAGITCDAMCKLQLKCGHYCQVQCHIIRNNPHKEIKCMEKCSRVCINGHPCPCGHKCHIGIIGCKCTVPYILNLACGHPRKVQCHEAVSARFKPCEKCIQENNKLIQSTCKSLASFKI